MSVTDSTSNRSVSRGRQPFSTGRGGSGNIRQPPETTDAKLESGPDDFSQTRGRELKVPVYNSSKAPQSYSTGRGGVGNMSSPTRDPQKRSIKEEEVIEEHLKSQIGAPVSSGRGGLGNISRSRVRDAGLVENIATGKSSLDKRHENDIKDHSIGGGSNANITTTNHEPPIELHHSGDGEGKIAKDD